MKVSGSSASTGLPDWPAAARSATASSVIDGEASSPRSVCASRRNMVRSRPAGLVKAPTMAWRQSITLSSRTQPSTRPSASRPISIQPSRRV